MSMVPVEFYLVVKADVLSSGIVRGRVTVRVTKNKPSLERDEVPVKMELRLPTSLFRRPQLTAEIVIPETSAPAEISAQVANNIGDIIREQTGLNVNITVGK